MKAQISPMLRFITEDANFEERLLLFKDMPWSVCWSIISAPYPSLAEFGCVSKLVTQTYDAVAVMVGEHAGIQSKLREVWKNEIFVHCYAHRLNLVLLQSVSFIKPVKILFAFLSDFGAYFSKSTKRTKALDCQVNKSCVYNIAASPRKKVTLRHWSVA